MIALLLPPIPVAVRTGFSAHLILNVIFLILAWIPAILHAWYVLLRYDADGNKRARRASRRSVEKVGATDDARVAALKKDDPLDEKMELERGMGHQQGWYAPPPAAAKMAQPQGQDEIQKVEVPQQQEPPTYVSPTGNQAPEYARDMKY